MTNTRSATQHPIAFNHSRQFTAPFCAPRCAVQPGFTGVSRASRRQFKRVLSPKIEFPPHRRNATHHEPTTYTTAAQPTSNKTPKTPSPNTYRHQKSPTHSTI